MDQRHFPNFVRLAVDRSLDRHHLTTEQSHIRTGSAVAPENGPLVHPVNNVLRGGYHRTPLWNSESNEFPSSLNFQVSHLQPAFPGPSHDPFPQSSAAGNEYMPQQNNSILSHPSHYDRYNVNQNVHGPHNSETRSRGTLKRKGPETSVTCERGSTSRFYGAGSSSSSFEMPQRKQSSNNLNFYSGHNELPHCGIGSFSAGEDSSRNVRSRSGLDLEANPTRTHLSGYSPHYSLPPNHLPNYHGAANLTNMNAGGTSQHSNFSILPSATHGRVQTSGTSGLSHGNNQLLVRGSGPEIRGCDSDFVSGRNVVSSSQYVHASIHSARGRRSSHSLREIPPYRPGPSFSHVRHVSTSTEHGLQPLSQPSFRSPSQSTGVWHGNFSNGTSGLAVERFRSIAGIVDAHDRVGAEDLMMDLSSFYASSRNLIDQYRDMRLDVDDMGYEELLALGERIGYVNTGVSDDVISQCLTEETYSSGQNNEVETCAICLEEYVNEVEIGALKNCGHNYHVVCIRKWLLMKNACPICKAPAHKDYSKEG